MPASLTLLGALGGATWAPDYSHGAAVPCPLRIAPALHAVLITVVGLGVSGYTKWVVSGINVYVKRLWMITWVAWTIMSQECYQTAATYSDLIDSDQLSSETSQFDAARQ